MKNNLLFTIGVFIATLLGAQAPQAFNYQAVARNAAGTALLNSSVALRISIHDGSATGTVVYAERDTATTNSFGLFTCKIGAGSLVSGNFSTISWGSGDKFMQVELDPLGGSSYTNMSTTQLLSVPYALYAKKSEPQNIEQVLTTGNNANANNLLNVAKVGVGTASPDPGAAVDITSTTGALLLPRMTTVQRDAITPVQGMVIYNTDSGKFQGYSRALFNYGNTDVNTGYGNGLGDPAGAIIFTPPVSGRVVKFRLWVGLSNAATSATLSVYNDKFSICTASPSVLGTSNNLTLVNSAWNEFVFPSPVALNAGVDYYIWSSAVISIDGTNDNPANTVTNWLEDFMGTCSFNSYDRPAEVVFESYGWNNLN